MAFFTKKDLQEMFGFPQMEVWLGVFSDRKSRTKRDKEGNIIEDIDRKGVNNAELMFILENGSDINNIPPRPALETSINNAERENKVDKALDKAMQAFFETGNPEDYILEIERFATRLEDDTTELFYANDGTFEDNKESTIRIKGFNHPLFRWGELANSIKAKAKVME